MPLVSTTVYLDYHDRERARKIAKRVGCSLSDMIRRGLVLATDDAIDEMKAVQRARLKARARRAKQREDDRRG